MKSNLAKKATLSFNITNNKMSAKKFQDYQNSGYYFSLEEVKKRIEDLTTQLKSSESYYRRHQPEVLTKEQREEILLENEIQDEIDFYEDQIYGFEDEDEEPHYHINDYCDPYLGRASPYIPDFDSNSEEEVAESEKESAYALNRGALIKDYHNPSILVSIIEAKEFIEDLLREFNNHKDYYKRREETFTQEEKEEKCSELENIQHEIYYYETSIFRTQQAYKEDPESIYGYSLRPRTPSVSDSDSDQEEPPTKIESLEKKLDGVENVVYQLLGGLFNQDTQSNVIDLHQCCLRGTNYLGSEIDTEKIWPTTRQGDKHEEEIQLLKQQVSRLEGTVQILIQLLAEKVKN
jgi:hypothetical protein